LAYCSIKKGAEFSSLEQAQKKIIDNAIRDFELSGVALEDDKKQRYMTLSQQLSNLTNQFEENLMDATNAWTKQVTDQALLAGLPESSMALVRQTADHKGHEGGPIKLKYPCYIALRTYADNRLLRYEIHLAFVPRAPELGPEASRWDDRAIIDHIDD